jgi:hypothetical protein
VKEVVWLVAWVVLLLISLALPDLEDLTIEATEQATQAIATQTKDTGWQFNYKPAFVLLGVLSVIAAVCRFIGKILRYSHSHYPF